MSRDKSEGRVAVIDSRAMPSIPYRYQEVRGKSGIAHATGTKGEEKRFSALSNIQVSS